MLNQGRQKTEKNRQKAQEAFLKMAHMQRQEAAQQRKEEKRRQEKERIMNEEDPEKARKMEVFAEPGNCGIGVFFFQSMKSVHWFLLSSMHPLSLFKSYAFSMQQKISFSIKFLAQGIKQYVKNSPVRV